ncbi:MAG: hypothetical protein GVY02_07765, partial [Bacteroidetes bacterium]|nr:hypothetical protein [Bacteroidota bacterium]
TLQKLVLNTGRSLLEGSGSLSDEGSLDQKFRFAPLSSRDLTLYAEDFPSFENVEIELGIDGRLDDLMLTLDAKAEGLEHLSLRAKAAFSENPTLTSLSLQILGLDAVRFTQMEIPGMIGSFSVSGEGKVLFEHPEQTDWEGSVQLERGFLDGATIGQLEAAYSLAGGRFRIDGEANNQGERLNFRGSVDSLFSESPRWSFDAGSDGLNPSAWSGIEELTGNLNVNADLRGESFDPERISGTASISVSGKSLAGQAFSGFNLQSEFDPDRISANVTARLDESRGEMEITLTNWMDKMSYEYDLAISRLNLAELNGLEAFPTFLNGRISGTGTSFNPDIARMVAHAVLDSSIVNGRRIEVLEADFRLEDKILYVEDAALKSSIADASFSLRQHIFEYADNRNHLNFQAELKDLDPLAPLFDLEKLDSKGEIRGNLGRNDEEMLEFNGSLNLEQVVIDTLFDASRVRGRISSFITDTPEVDLNLMLMEPQVMGVSVQDVQAYSYIQIDGRKANGNFSFRVTNGNESSLTQGGYFRADSSSLQIDTETLVFETDLRALTLSEPFRITYENETFRSDTLTIATEDQSSYLSFWLPELGDRRLQMGLSAQNLEVGVLQQTLLKEKYFDGNLNGAFLYESSNNDVQANANLFVTEIQYSDTKIDSLRIESNIAEEWLKAEGSLWNNGERLAEGNLHVPYLPGDPLTFDESFFQRSVEGRFTLNSSDLGYWFSFLPMEAMQATEGLISAGLELTGEAGNPELSGVMLVENGSFSGIPVEYIDVNAQYDHDEGKIEFEGLVEQSGVEILDFDGNVPFSVNLRTFDLDLPTGPDPISASIETNQFDLALFNSYIDQSQIRQLSGQLEGRVEIGGVIDKPESEGRLQIRDASALLVQAGVRYRNIYSDILFEPNRITLEKLQIDSDPGRLEASGYISMEGLTPGELDLQAEANRFGVFNTQEIRALMNLQANLTGTFQEPLLQGQLTFLEGYYTLEDFGDDAIEKVELDDEEEARLSPLEAMTVDMSVNFDRRFLIRNSGYLSMEFDLGGRIDFVKEMNEELQLFGTLNSTDGYVSPLGKQFDIEEAAVFFFGPVTNPQLSITSSYTPPQAAGVEIRYVIEGTLEEPEFRFESDPPLSLQDQISYTLFGKPYYELESWEQVISGSGSSPTAQDLALDVLLDRVSMLATRQLGIDVVIIDQSRSGSNNTVIKTGWYLNEDTFFAILNEIDGVRPNTLFVLEYLLQENLELVITQGDDNRQGIDLRWHKDY